MPITVVGFFTFTEEKYKKELLEALGTLVVHTRENEPGTTNYTFMQDSEDPLILMAVEEWVDDEAFATHMASEPFKEFFAIVGPMLEAGNLSIHQKTSKTPMVSGFGPR
jgi:quinol monooxygenase YgiN